MAARQLDDQSRNPLSQCYRSKPKAQGDPPTACQVRLPANTTANSLSPPPSFALALAKEIPNHTSILFSDREGVPEAGHSSPLHKADSVAGRTAAAIEVGCHPAGHGIRHSG